MLAAFAEVTQLSLMVILRGRFGDVYFTGEKTGMKKFNPHESR